MDQSTFFKKSLFLFAIFSLLSTSSLQLYAHSDDPRFIDFQRSQEVIDPNLTGINRIAVGLSQIPEKGYAVYEVSTKRIQPTFTRSVFALNNNTTNILEISPTTTAKENLVDKEFKTSTRFDFDKSRGYSFVILKLDKPISTTNLSYYLDSNVQNPEEIAIQSKLSGGSNEYQTILSRRENYTNAVSFPDVFADVFKIEFFHKQPLRIQEIDIGVPSNNLLEQQIVWLGRPGEKYRLYTDAQKYTNLPTEEAGNLANIEDNIITTKLDEGEPNEAFRESDTDKDGIIDKKDNCPTIKNPDQKDTDNNSKGDICEDKDGDSILDGVDNCPLYANRSQLDTDKNGVGDVCEDKDNDKIPNGSDNCPTLANADQKDTDQDKVGDVCDTNGDSRWLQNNQVFNWLALVFGFVVIGGLSYLTIRKKN
jgi:hypothetical protein